MKKEVEPKKNNLFSILSIVIGLLSFNLIPLGFISLALGIFAIFRKEKKILYIIGILTSVIGLTGIGSIFLLMSIFSSFTS